MTARVAHGAHPSLLSEDFRPLDEASAATYDGLLREALAEDVGRNDVTTNALIPAAAQWGGTVVARAPGVIAGLPLAARVFMLVDPQVLLTPIVSDGSRVEAGAKLASVSGPARGLLTGERVALNFLGRLSGIATLTRKYVDAARAATAPAGTAPRIADTRKTTPRLRALERYAVRAGGGANHRFDLAGAVLIKDNHLAAVGSVAEAVRRAREHAGPGIIVEVECDSLGQVREALVAGADSILLDNMAIDTMREAVTLAHDKAIVEASGGMALERVAEVASAGVDVISVGALTHSAPALDVALDFDAELPEART